MLAARGVPAEAVLSKVLALSPPKKKEAVDVDLASLREALESRYSEMLAPTSTDVAPLIGGSFQNWRPRDTSKRQAAAQILIEVLQISPWPEPVCQAILGAAAEGLALRITMRRI